MKKNKLTLLLVILLAIVALGLILSQTSSTLKSELSNFAIDDTASVTRIFLADKLNRKVTLTRRDAASWVVDNKYPANQYNINLLLKTMLKLEVREPVAKAAHNNIVKRMAATSVKVEIYQIRYRINLFGKVKWFPHEKLTRTYYVGSATQDNRGTYMLMQNSTTPFVTYLPGLRGFVTPRYSSLQKDWRDYTVFKKDPRAIVSARVEIPSEPEQSFEVRRKPGGKGFELVSLMNSQVQPVYDTLRLINFLSGFHRLGFEALLNNVDTHLKDSITHSKPFHIITLTDTAGNVQSLKTFHKPASGGEYDMEGNPVLYDRDRLYALVNKDEDFVLIQFYVFDRILKPLSFYIGSGSSDKK